MKLGVFWGAFDPVTKGHVAVINAVLERYGLDKLYVVVNVHKKSPHRIATSILDRVNMLNLVVSGNERIEVLEQHEAELSYESLKSNLAEDDELYAVVGSDSFNIGKQYCTGLDKVIVIPRDEEKVDFGEMTNVDVLLVGGCGGVSSTKVRNLLKQGQNVDELPKDVKNYIKSARLYH